MNKLITLILLAISVGISAQQTKIDPKDQKLFDNFRMKLLKPIIGHVIDIRYRSGKMERMTIEAYEIKLNKVNGNLMMAGDFGWEIAVKNVYSYKLVRKYRVR